MFDTLVCAAGTVLAVIGLVAAASLLMLRLVRPKKGERFFQVLVFDGAERDACARVSFLLSQQMCAGSLRSCTILAVDNGMPSWRRQNLEEAFGREPHVVICSPDRAKELLFAEKTD